MSQYLPTGGFTWVEDLSIFTEDYIKNLKDDSPIGYIMEVDLEYPDHLHDLHDQYSLCPQHLDIQEHQLSDHQKKLAAELNCKIGGKKLCLTLENKKNYITHYRLLRQCLRLGMKLTKVHRVLQFNQSPWVKPYIEKNTRLRQTATCKAEEDLPKLMNNSFFGKTCEDTRRYKTVQIFIGEEREMTVQKAQNDPRFYRIKSYGEYFCAIQMLNQEVLLDKPRYVGMSVLSISKEVMYNFHYNFIIPNFPDTKLGFTDTDSFCYEIPCETDIYQKFKELDPEEEWMDWSNYPEDHPNFSMKNKLIPGKFKDEGAGSPFAEGFFLRSKMYCLINEKENLNKSTAKGINKTVKDKFLKRDNYYNALFNPAAPCEDNDFNKVIMKRIVCRDHKMYTVSQRKTGLSSYNDKLWISRINDSEWKTHRYGHYSLRK